MKTTSDFEQIVLNDTPLIDVRAPIEYDKGSFKNTVNIPIMNDQERHEVGIIYKEKGNDAATALGYELVSGKIKEERVNAWLNQIKQEKNSLLYCFRGGSRSKITQEWIYESSGKEITRIEGGYKAFRNYLIDALLPENQKSIPILLGGYTGAGKSILLNKLDNSIDLERIANHRGSSFGRHVTDQPTQINFENNLSYAIIKHNHKNYKYLILEDEGAHVGKCYIPKPLFHYFNDGNLVFLDIPFEERVTNTYNEYVLESQEEHLKYFGNDKGIDEWSNYIIESLNKIKKRLGIERYQQIITLFHDAYKHQLNTGDKSSHRNWLGTLLKEYYDPMYHYQMEKTTKKILYKGNEKEVLDYLKTNFTGKR